jgi:hypothetical protein
MLAEQEQARARQLGRVRRLAGREYRFAHLHPSGYLSGLILPAQFLGGVAERCAAVRGQYPCVRGCAGLRTARHADTARREHLP